MRSIRLTPWQLVVAAIAITLILHPLLDGPWTTSYAQRTYTQHEVSDRPTTVRLLVLWLPRADDASVDVETMLGRFQQHPQDGATYDDVVLRDATTIVAVSVVTQGAADHAATLALGRRVLDATRQDGLLTRARLRDALAQMDAQFPGYEVTAANGQTQD